MKFKESDLPRHKSSILKITNASSHHGLHLEIYVSTVQLEYRSLGLVLGVNLINLKSNLLLLSSYVIVVHCSCHFPFL